MNRLPDDRAAGFQRRAFQERPLEASERLARYAYLAPILEGALAAELLPPWKSRFPCAPFLEETCGAAAAVTVICSPQFPPTEEALTAVENKGAGETPVFLIDDGNSWVSDLNALDALTAFTRKRLPRALFVFVLRDTSGTALASLGESPAEAGDERRSASAGFSFAASERALRERFPCVRFAAQCALWGSQIAPLPDGKMSSDALEQTIDGRLADRPRAAFFIALCSPKKIDLPREMALCPLPLFPLNTAAKRFERLEENLRRERAETKKLRAALEKNARTAADLDVQKSEADSARQRALTAEESLREVQDRLRRAESLLDAVADERSGLLSRLSAAEADLEKAKAALNDAASRAKEAEAERECALREREAHLSLSQAALKELQEIVQRQDAHIAELENHTSAQELMDAQNAQTSARISQLSAELEERELKLDFVSDGLRELASALGRLSRERTGKAIDAALEAMDDFLSDMSAAGIELGQGENASKPAAARAQQPAKGRNSRAGDPSKAPKRSSRPKAKKRSGDEAAEVDEP